ncbi:hypothetical protein [Stenotrophomonas sp. Iso1]|uniref:hypothetical protein n=1 Tax=Stenotrophomonas sp. Iso1 TaxID=2977283 RepID=UPI0022B783B8|nr:hypothetical protein [Stenotrophomonas sp. Iso1]
MEVQNPYLPPVTPPEITAASTRAPAPVEHEEVYPELFAPSTGKLILMSLTTFGLYTLYWFYRNWRAIAEHEGESLWPFWRAVFAPLWVFSGFSRLNGYASSRRRQLAFPPVMLALIYFLINFAGNLSVFFPRVVGRNSWVISLLVFLPLLPVNSLMRRYRQSLRMGTAYQDRLTVWHVLVIVFGGLLLLMALAGMFLRG